MPIPINISASTGAAILGQSKWSTPISHWLRIMESRQPGFCAKNNYELPVFEGNAATRFGHAFESAIIELAENKSEIGRIGNREGYFTKPIDGEPAITCHIDGRYMQVDFDNLTIHEGKTTNYFSWLNNFARGKDGEPDRIPVDHLIQCNHGMLCTGAKKVIMSVLVFPKRQQDWENEGIVIEKHAFAYFLNLPGDRNLLLPSEWAISLNEMGFFHQYTIESDSRLQDLMLKKYEYFWRVNVIGEKEPELQDMSDVKAIIKDPVGTIILKDDHALLAKEAQQIAKEEKIMKTRKDKLKIEICQAGKDGEKFMDDDSKEKWIFNDEYGNKLATMAKSGFRFAKSKD